MVVLQFRSKVMVGVSCANHTLITKMERSGGPQQGGGNMCIVIVVCVCVCKLVGMST